MIRMTFIIIVHGKGNAGRQLSGILNDFKSCGITGIGDAVWRERKYELLGPGDFCRGRPKKELRVLAMVSVPHELTVISPSFPPQGLTASNSVGRPKLAFCDGTAVAWTGRRTPAMVFF